jgi:outer membrane protein TolC
LLFVIETSDIAELKALIVSLQAEIKRLRAENEELKARLSQTSANSHKPPASQGYQKKPVIKPALPKVPGKSRADNPDILEKRWKWSPHPTPFNDTRPPTVSNAD